jgi:hypothetical protein
MNLQEKLEKHPFGPWTLALYGLTHSGKSSQAAKVAKHIFDKSGLKTLWFLYDEGDTPAEADAGIAAGYIIVQDMRMVPHPFHTANKIASGLVPQLNGQFDEKTLQAGGSFVAFDYSTIGLVVVDSGTALADVMFKDLSAKAAMNINIGGEGAMNFKDGDAGWGTTMVGSSNRAHYGVVQTRMHDFISRMKQLSSRFGVMVIMTFAEDRGEQDSTKVTLIGPKTKGGAQTVLIPGWFKFTFRLVCLPGGQNKEPKHVLWTERHKDGGIEALANRRFPILTEEQQKPYPPMYDPADVVKALTTYQSVVKIIGAK